MSKLTTSVMYRNISINSLILKALAKQKMILLKQQMLEAEEALAQEQVIFLFLNSLISVFVKASIKAQRFAFEDEMKQVRFRNPRLMLQGVFRFRRFKSWERKPCKRVPR